MYGTAPHSPADLEPRFREPDDAKTIRSGSVVSRVSRRQSDMEVEAARRFANRELSSADARLFAPMVERIKAENAARERRQK